MSDASPSSGKPPSTAPAEGAAGPAAASAAPTEFPLDFDAWASDLHPGYGLLVAGMRHELLQAGGLVAVQSTLRLPADWRKDFDAFMARPLAAGARK